jgi:hypothetical protein
MPVISRVILSLLDPILSREHFEKVRLACESATTARAERRSQHEVATKPVVRGVIGDPAHQRVLLD